MDPNYSFWVATTVIGLMVAALAWFIKRLVSELENKIAASDKANRERMDALEKRVDRQEDRYDMLLTQLPEKYALRDDLIRMSQNISAELGALRDLIIRALGRNGKEGSEC